MLLQSVDKVQGKSCQYIFGMLNSQQEIQQKNLQNQLELRFRERLLKLWSNDEYQCQTKNLSLTLLSVFQIYSIHQKLEIQRCPIQLIQPSILSSYNIQNLLSDGYIFVLLKQYHAEQILNIQTLQTHQGLVKFVTFIFNMLVVLQTFIFVNYQNFYICQRNKVEIAIIFIEFFTFSSSKSFGLVKSKKILYNKECICRHNCNQYNKLKTIYIIPITSYSIGYLIAICITQISKTAKKINYGSFHQY
ncbi:unnamed protein product [Paramecium octaurelia]|uniref:Transmembrane protein n=1 Tax=Paramecium octaurelia TaxID=43137 RepID=A0A8S1YB27_PAROT|nr:unnamed protein product [Paramecium octaurelia]